MAKNSRGTRRISSAQSYRIGPGFKEPIKGLYLRLQVRRKYNTYM